MSSKTILKSIAVQNIAYDDDESSLKNIVFFKMMIDLL